MEVRGANFGNYDARHISQVQREIARSVKPNILRQLEDQDLDEATFQRILAEDLVDLSPEAKDLLDQLRKERRKGKTKRDPLDPQRQQDFLSLLDGLDQLRRQVEEDNLKEGLLQRDFRPAMPFFPPSIPLSNHSDAPRPRPRTVEPSSVSLNRAGEMARKMVVHASRPELKEQVGLELQVFGIHAVEQVKKFGVRIIVLDRHMSLTDIRINNMYVVAPSERTFDGRPWSQVRGLYEPSRRMLVVGEELVGLRNRSTARHEFGHAYDHMFTEKNARKMPLSVQLWNSFRGERRGLVSEYAATNPAEYFAESVEAFFQEGSPRDHLRQHDPEMFQYLAQLFVA